MKTKHLTRIPAFGIGFLILLLTLHSQFSALAEETAFTYQGRLNDSAGPINGFYDFTFAVYDLPTGNGLFAIQTNLATRVTNGLFTATIDFGPVVSEAIFSGAQRWLEIDVRTNGSSGYAILSPRQRLTATPYAITAGSLVSGGLAGTFTNTVTFSNLNNSFFGNGGGLTNVNATTLGGFGYCDLPCYWNLSGNAGTTALNFLGTTDSQPLTLKVQNVSAVQIRPGVTLPNIVAGIDSFRPTVLGANVSGAVIAGGNAPSGGVTGFGAGDFMAAYDNDGAIGGGFGNKVGSNDGDPTDAAFATVGGGVFNSAANYAATVGGGDGNLAGGVRSVVAGGSGNSATADYSSIGGGAANTVQTSGVSAIIGGGTNNIVSAPRAVVSGGDSNLGSGAYATVSGGGYNQATGRASFVGGGGGRDAFGGGPYPNTASGDWSVVGGGWDGIAAGYSSTIGGGAINQATNFYATVPGGLRNVAGGTSSFAAGQYAQALHAGSFVWGDSQSIPFASTGNDEFCIRAKGGVQLSTNTSVFCGNQTRQMLNLWGTQYGIGVQSLTTYFRCDSASTTAGFSWFKGGVHNDNQNNPGGGVEMMRLNDSGLTVSAITITGGADLAEPFELSGSSKELSEGAVVVIDEENPGRLKLSDRPYDTHVAGVLSGANGINPGIQLRQNGVLEHGKNVALTGRVFVRVDTSNGSVKPGDLLTTSAVPGYAMKVTNHARARGAILGKAMTGLNTGKGMVLVLVSLQ